MIALDAAAVSAFTRPTNSRMVSGGSPAASTMVGVGINVAMPDRRSAKIGRGFGFGRRRSGSSQVLRRVRGGAGYLVRGRPRRSGCVPGPERGRQDDHGRDPRGLTGTVGGLGVGARGV